MVRQVSARGVRQRRAIDKYGRSRGNGKRKTARAKVTVLPGEGQVYVNGKPATEYFTRSKDVENVIWPLQSLCVLGNIMFGCQLLEEGRRDSPRRVSWRLRGRGWLMIRRRIKICIGRFYGWV
jgi:ribosomal protein L24E